MNNNNYEWQPIETAPRDGTWILVTMDYYIEQKWFVTKWNYKLIYETPHSWIGILDNHFPTHWMPLPKPPEIK